MFSVKGIPYIVNVFATNGRGKGEDGIQLFYSEEDREYSIIIISYTELMS